MKNRKKVNLIKSIRDKSVGDKKQVLEDLDLKCDSCFEADWSSIHSNHLKCRFSDLHKNRYACINYYPKAEKLDELIKTKENIDLLFHNIMGVHI